MVDESYDPDFPFPHLDPPELGEVRLVGKDKAIVQLHKDYSAMASGRGFPWEDGIDYDAALDEDQESNDE